MNNPFFGFIKTIVLLLSQRVRFDKTVVSHKIEMPDGEVFTIFRRVEIVSKKAPEPCAYFIVRFKVRNMSIKQNIIFSLVPMMIFMGFKGFRRKYWAVNYETGLNQGLYEWQTLKDAENYSKSIAMKFMSKRSIPESVEYKIIDKSIETLKYTVN